MSLRLQQPSSLASKGTVLELEEKLGITLPSDYREFLLEVNGGRVVSGGVCRAYPDGRKITRVAHFLGVSEVDFESLQTCTRDLEGRIDPALVPVAYDGGGNLIFLSCEGPLQGHVFFADLESLNEEQPAAPESLTLVARSFQEFLERVQEE
jgi:cell wall assembly regulator SMI1